MSNPGARFGQPSLRASREESSFVDAEALTGFGNELCEGYARSGPPRGAEEFCGEIVAAEDAGIIRVALGERRSARGTNVVIDEPLIGGDGLVTLRVEHAKAKFVVTHGWSTAEVDAMAGSTVVGRMLDHMSADGIEVNTDIAQHSSRYGPHRRGSDDSVSRTGDPWCGVSLHGAGETPCDSSISLPSGASPT